MIFKRLDLFEIQKDAHLVEKQISSEEVFAGRLLHVRNDEVSLPNGALALREYITHPGAVVIIAVLPNGNLVFERQFRYPVGSVFLELPAGKIDQGEAILATAKRELLEETGFTAQSWRYLGKMHPCIGYSDEKIEIFLAQDLCFTGSNHLDEGEFLDVFEMSLVEAEQAVRTGEITDAKTITALFWAKGVLEQGW